MTCPSCVLWEDRWRAQVAENLELRLQVADGPRHRVNELERHLAKANARIIELQGFKVDTPLVYETSALPWPKKGPRR